MIDQETWQTRIDARDVRIAVVGLGYVGLPVAVTFANAGFHVVGVERIEQRAAMVRGGHNPIEGDEPGLSEALRRVVSSGHLDATSELARVADVDVVIVCVETPVESHDHRPRYAALEGAVRGAAEHLRADALFIVESTLAPGTMEAFVRGWLESSCALVVGQTLSMGHCPERVMPGRLLPNLRTMSRVCGGDSPATSVRMKSLYATIVEAELDAASCVVAELTKTAENTFRDVNIAFANELAKVCEVAGADFLEVRGLVNKSPGRNVLIAGTGVGGHCIPKDPWLFASGLPSGALALVPAARLVNDGMPLHLLELVGEALAARGQSLEGARVLVLGYAYLEESDDERNTPSEVLVEALRALGADVRIHDPFVQRFSGEIDVVGVDAIVIAVAHRAYRDLDWAELQTRVKTPVLVDGRFVIEPSKVRQLGWEFRGIGRARR